MFGNKNASYSGYGSCLASLTMIEPTLGFKHNRDDISKILKFKSFEIIYNKISFFTSLNSIHLCVKIIIEA